MAVVLRACNTQVRPCVRRYGTMVVQELITKLVDRLGQESATAQGLNKVITSAEKMKKNPGHVIYMLKDKYAKDCKGDIIGMLKVGRKHLFLFDDKQIVHEVEPPCVLDFYVVRDRQRMGHGYRLFQHMLTDLEVNAWEMAIDGPSEKMEKFLARNFGIDRLMRQSNNFAVSTVFFQQSDADISTRGALSNEVPAAAVGRFAAPKPTSAIANWPVGFTSTKWCNESDNLSDPTLAMMREVAAV
uniref:Alpha-tubulin N-acetyltransferase n=1 Tax=Heliothis virescens TaxID=7102 RepID=A0A2A4JCB2_HELVI